MRKNDAKRMRRKGIVSQAFFMMLTILVSTFAFSFLIAAPSQAVEAQEYQVCCEKLKGSDLFCQNAQPGSCDSGFQQTPTSCDSTSYCKLGCCYDSVEGTCAENTPRKVCELRGGTWDSHANCEIAQCVKGCCVLGDEASLTTLVRCKKLATYYGLGVDYRAGVSSEAECIALAEAEDKGACVIETVEGEVNCKFTTRSECKKLAIEEDAFHKDFLCSAEELGTSCARQHHTGCVSGKDEVYWFDSCGNAENIYDSNKERSWNNGRVLSKDESCSAGLSNAESSSCGNCEYYLGSICGEARLGIEPRPAYGNYVCRDINCKDTSNGNDYKHGESWCVYDAAVGEGQDVVGSRHWRHLCVMGEEKVEPCADYRQEICLEDKVDVEGTPFNEAICRPNAWRLCLDYNTKSNAKDLCEDTSDCYWTTIWKTDLCLPEVPSGFKTSTSEGGTVASSLCGQASTTCNVVYEKKLSGWECISNCECKGQAWVDSMNKWCTNLGDCGAYYNINGEFTDDGYETTGTANEPGKTGLGKEVLLPVAGVGTLMMWSGGVNAEIVAGKEISSIFVKGFANVGKWMQGQGLQGPLITMASAAVAAAIITAMFGLKGDAAKTVGFIGVASAGTFSILVSKGIITAKTQILGKFITWFGGWGPFFFSVVVMVLVAVFMKLMGVGNTKEETITFTCLPWQPPTGGEDCEKCNTPPIGGDMKPCSDYRCNSLGASCSMLNTGTDNELCVWLNRDDTRAPTIKPWENVLTKDHKYVDVKPCPPGPGCWKIERQGATDGCIKAFTPLEFGVITDEPAQCKIDYEHSDKVDDMRYWFGETNLYLYNHSVTMSLPGPTHVNAQSPELENDGKYTLYVRCSDGNGNSNTGEMAIQFCVEPGPDTTPASIERTSIENGAPVAAGTEKVDLDVFLNEPAACKWSLEDQDYENMPNTFTCAKSLQQMEWDMTYKCKTTLTNIEDRVTNTYYFRCNDQPWLAGVNDSDRNMNKESYKFTLEGTMPLNITSVLPNGTHYWGSEPMAISLEVKTANGYNYGEAKCYYSTTGYDAMIEFFETDASEHQQDLNLLEGSYKYYILCRDAGGNIDKSTTEFELEIDKTPPMVVRVYQDSGMLKILTDEDSDCRYSIKECNFDFTTATEMPFEGTTEHTAEWRTDITYYIKCMDEFGNLPWTSDCSMQVNAYDVETASE